MLSVESIFHKDNADPECEPRTPEWTPEAKQGLVYMNSWVDDWDDVNCSACLARQP